MRVVELDRLSNGVELQVWFFPPFRFAQSHLMGPDAQKLLKALTGGSTVPRVFIGGEFAGGSDDVHQLDAEGKLLGLLRAAGALP